jgi:hypothetical protein
MNEEQFGAALADLVRGKPATLDAYFHAVEADVQVGTTNARCHFHCINLDGNGRPRVDALVKHLIGHVIDYAIPRKRIEEALRYQEETGSAYKHTMLLLEAMGLFSKLAKSGEGGELILFLMAERFLQLPQLICKMNLKTSTQMHYHGADGLHVGVDPKKNKLCLYWGESKLYGDVTKAVYQCMKSLAPLLLGAGGLGSPEERDLQLLGQYVNVEDPTLEAALKRFLDPDDPAHNSVEYCGICLVGFDYGEYPNEPNKVTVEEVRAAISTEIAIWQEAVGKRLTAEKIDSFAVHVFLIPFPSVEEFRASLKSAMSPSHDNA